MAALIKVNGLRSGGADKPGFGLGHFGPRQDFLAAESRSMRGTPGRPDVPGSEPTAASLTSISNQKGDILYSVPPGRGEGGGSGFWKQLSFRRKESSLCRGRNLERQQKARM